MPESLKELSDRATPGRLDAQDLDLECQGFTLIAVPDETRVGGTPTLGLVAIVTLLPSECPLDHNGPDPRRARANAEYLSRLWTDHRAGRLHDDTALATAVARARREALEEAAEVVEREAGQHNTDTATIFRIQGAYFRRRALAATPPEARQTEANP